MKLVDLVKKNFILICSVTIFIGSFLLFQVQPLINKYILPWFGGSSAVWMTSMFFFQVLLLLGYAYSHFITRLSYKRQGILHIIIVLFSLLLIFVTSYFWKAPILPGIFWKNIGDINPTFSVMKVLFVGVGIPYFVLTTTSSLIQYWYGRVYQNKSPYQFYMLSNAGALLALISYPLIIEPFTSVVEQANYWGIMFLLYGILMITSGIIFSLLMDPENSKPLRDGNVILNKTKFKDYFRWIVPAFFGSVLLMATTNQITQEIVNIPFLWVLPLTLYLLSFIITFNDRAIYKRKLFAIGYLLVSGLVIIIMIKHSLFAIQYQLLIYSIFLFLGFGLCHGEVYRIRPNSSQLTAFYLSISIGGALGGVLVSLISPLIFKLYWEFYIGFFGGVIIAFVVLMNWSFSSTKKKSSISLMRRGIEVLLLFSLIFLFFKFSDKLQKRAISTSRNFYGVVRIIDDHLPNGKPYRKMAHGQTIHGIQFLDPKLKKMPTAYFTTNSGIGLVFKTYRKLFPQKHFNIGVIGLGAGTIAAYGRAGDQIKFYEIDPDVITGAHKYFSFISDTKASVSIVTGDARLSLEQEIRQGEIQEYDIFVLDAFSSGTIPVHLLTEEAFEIYAQHLKPRGVFAFHISNIYFDFSPIIKSMADKYNYHVLFTNTWGDGLPRVHSSWAILSKSERFMKKSNFEPYLTRGKIKIVIPWRDDFSNVISLLKKDY